MIDDPIVTHFVDVRFTPAELGELCDLVSDKTDFYRQLETKLNRNYNDIMSVLAKENVSVTSQNTK